MSRCFSFPPPGYELKPRSDDVDLLAKEKHDEKKHKKEKRDKRKRKDGERRVKEKSKDEHKEKKHRKDKHREKKRHKDKSFVDERPEQMAQGHDEAQVHDYSRKMEEVSNSNFTEDLFRRSRYDSAAIRIPEIVDVSTKKGIICLGEQSSVGKETISDKEMVARDSRTKKKKIEVPLESADLKIQGNEKSRESSCLYTNNIIGEQRDNRVGQPLEDWSTRSETKQQLNSYKIAVNLGYNNQSRNYIINKHADYLIYSEQRRNEGLFSQLQSSESKGISSLEKAKESKANDRKLNGDARPDQEKKRYKRKHKDGNRNEDKDKKRENHEQKHRRHRTSDNILDKGQGNSSTSQEDNLDCAAVKETCRKRKDHMRNGLLHENHLPPGKLPKLVASFPSHVENWVTGCTSQLAPTLSSKNLELINFAIDGHRASDSSECIINDGGSLTSVELGPTPAAYISQNDEASLKSPHPDSKYLDVIYSVPPAEDLVEFTDQDWLFHNHICSPKRQTGMNVDEITQEVWSQALKLEAPDVLALPYVVPY